jgi:hypothetical protein
MARHGKTAGSRRRKTTPAGRPKPPKTGFRRKNPSSPDLPPNEKVNKYPDELYGDTEIPTR